MAKMAIRGLEFEANVCKDSYNRRALQYKNNIISTLSKIGVKEDQTDIPIENVAIKKAPANITWYFDGHKLYYSYQAANRFVDNMYVASKVIELKVKALINDEITLNDFLSEFSEGDDIEKQRKEARETLGVPEDSMDFALIDKNFKILAKEFHPDMPNGDPDRFKKINKAHKILKKELE